MDNEAFWDWFKQDYRNMLDLVPNVDGLVLTFIETGARAENQYSQKLLSKQEKLAKVVDEVADVVINERHLNLYIRTFSYTQQEYDNIMGAVNLIKNPDVRLMIKETPHDFFLTHPDDPYAGTINRPTIIEFDTGNEFNGQGKIANTWPEKIIERWSEFLSRPGKENIIGYVARTDRFKDSRIIGQPSEILLYALKRYAEDHTVNADQVYDEFITQKYGAASLPYVKSAFKKAYDIVTSSLNAPHKSRQLCNFWS